jgi:serine/threonine-protein phosphatase 2A regulatory subunit A
MIESSILPIMDRLVEDDIPNIRFNVAKSYAALIGVLKKLPETGTLETAEKEGKSLTGSHRGSRLIEDRILPNLERLQQDDDVDVIYFAKTAASSANAGGEPMQT